MTACAKSPADRRGRGQAGRRAGSGNVLALLAGLLVAGCQSGASISFDDLDPSYDPNEVQTGSLPVVVRGNPFPIAQAEFDRRVAAAMSDRISSGRHFVPSAGTGIVYRVIMDFQGGAEDPKKYCADVDRLPLYATGPVQPMPAYGPTTVLAVLCRADREMSAVYGALDRVSGPDDPVFAQGIGLIVARLFPARNPMNQNDNGGGELDF